MRQKRAKQLRRFAAREAKAFDIQKQAGLLGDEDRLPWWARLCAAWRRFWYGPPQEQRRNERLSSRYSYQFLKRYWKEGRHHGKPTN